MNEGDDKKKSFTFNNSHNIFTYIYVCKYE